MAALLIGYARCSTEQQDLIDGLGERYRRYGLAVTEARPAATADVAATRSTWGKRLHAGAGRPAWLVRARFEPPATG